MCWVCNPFCGACKPPMNKPIQCTVCKRYNLGEVTNCKKCGALLPERPKPPVVKCLYTGKLCAKHCGKYKQVHPDGILMPCKLNTPPEENTELPVESTKSSSESSKNI